MGVSIRTAAAGSSLVPTSKQFPHVKNCIRVVPGAMFSASQTDVCGDAVGLHFPVRTASRNEHEVIFCFGEDVRK